MTVYHCKQMKEYVDVIIETNVILLLFRVGMHLDVAMEKLNVCGKLEVLLTVDMEASFPHVTEVSVMFIEKPEVWFSIRMLKVCF